MNKKARSMFMRRDGIRLFLMTLPFLALVFVFCYFPLFGWSFAFFNYKPGLPLYDCEFVGFKYFTMAFQNPLTARNVMRVIVNTLGISGIGLLTSFIPMIFAVFLTELSSAKYRKIVQTVTTIPNFISWILVFSLAYSMFSVDSGFINRIILSLNPSARAVNFLASSEHIWLKMWALGTWKGLGWSAIIYIASISSIDDSLYEAAAIDGAGRFQKMRYITIPGLLPTYFVLLMLAIASVLNNGFEQYYVFQNAMNHDSIEVLDLYVYNQGILSSNVSYSTAVGMLKSLISVILLFTANHFSRLIRDESIF